MRFSPIVLLLFALPGCGSEPANQLDSKSQAIAAIMNFGGSVLYDENSPNKPVRTVFLSSSLLTDEGM